MYAYGGTHYEMLVSGNLKRTSELGYRDSKHKEEKEYRAWKGFAVGAFVALFTIVFGIIFGCNQKALSADVAENLSTGMAILLLATVILPLFWGVLGLSGQIVRGKTPVLADVFLPFSGKVAYRRAIWLSFSWLWRVGGTAGVVALTYSLALYFAGGSLPGGILCGVLIVLELTLGFVLLLRWFPVAAVALSCEEYSAEEILREASRFRKAQPFAGFYFFMGFLPLLALGVLTVGILLLADVLPRMCVGYFQYCNFMTDSLIRLEEDKHE
jgi:hypothetical protein